MLATFWPNFQYKLVSEVFWNVGWVLAHQRNTELWVEYSACKDKELPLRDPHEFEACICICFSVKKLRADSLKGLPLVAYCFVRMTGLEDISFLVIMVFL